MSGLILIFIIVLWIMAVKKLTTFLSRWIPASKYNGLFKALLFTLLLVMPFMDEIIGGFQFRALCKSEAVATYDESKVRGKTVHLKNLSRTNLTGTVLPVYKRTLKYVDHITNEELISYVELHSDGGWLSRWIDFNSVDHPYTFDGNCSGGNYLFENLNINSVNE